MSNTLWITLSIVLCICYPTCICCCRATHYHYRYRIMPLPVVDPPSVIIDAAIPDAYVLIVDPKTPDVRLGKKINTNR